MFMKLLGGIYNSMFCNSKFVDYNLYYMLLILILIS